MRFPRWLAALALSVFVAVPLVGVQDAGAQAPVTQSAVAPVQADDVLVAVSFDAVIDGTSREQVEKLLEVEAKLEHRPQALILVFNSPGGDVDEGMRIARDFEQSEIPVFCVVDGQAASMAFYILQSCAGRFMTKRSTLMAHEPSNGVPMTGNRFEHERWADALKVTALAMAEHESKRMHITYAEFLARTHDRDWGMGWEEAAKTGAVDSVFGTSDEAIRFLRQRLAQP